MKNMKKDNKKKNYRVFVDACYFEDGYYGVCEYTFHECVAKFETLEEAQRFVEKNEGIIEQPEKWPDGVKYTEGKEEWEEFFNFSVNGGGANFVIKHRELIPAHWGWVEY